MTSSKTPFPNKVAFQSFEKGMNWGWGMGVGRALSNPMHVVREKSDSGEGQSQGSSGKAAHQNQKSSYKFPVLVPAQTHSSRISGPSTWVLKVFPWKFCCRTVSPLPQRSCHWSSCQARIYISQPLASKVVLRHVSGCHCPT